MDTPMNEETTVADHGAETTRTPIVREIDETELADWARAYNSGNFLPQRPGAADRHRQVFEPGRWLAAYEGPRCVATLRGLALDVSVPGGAALPAAGVSSLSVVPTHRRRGLMKALMTHALRAAAARGEAAAVLHSAEYPVYGRYGFAPVTRHGGFAVDVTAARGLRPGPVGTGELRHASMEDIRRWGPALFDRARRTRPGAVSRSDRHWLRRTGGTAPAEADRVEPTAVVHHDADGRPSGLLLYRVDGKWTDGVPDSTLTVSDLIATTPEALRALWGHLLALDWIRRIEVPDAAPDDPLPLLLVNARAVRPLPGPADCLWLRLLDLPAALAARTYPAAGALVLQVADEGGYVGGRWRLDAAADGSGRAAPTDDPADLALDAAALAALYLGGESASRLAAAGLVAELRPGALRTADTLFPVPVAPWCPDHF
ncbi:GNAT family N-acetyltransferase [Streptomyces sp. NPDC018031]|uniref:GNAT family N-acetyltransferase n=1 Tax=Streptomyces sp. NPDC018031 TaxID=3365033 RepID=UPI0037AE8C3C